MISIKSFIETSFLDWDGKISSVIFLPYCNLRCIYCHNHKLVSSPSDLPDITFKKIFDYLSTYKNWLDGVCITGGEPCLHEDLKELLIEIKRLDFLIKLDTNGCYPEKLKELINQKLIDYIAMDIKAPLIKEKYIYITNTKNIEVDKIRESIEILHSSKINYEFRTTVIPGLIGKEEIKNIAEVLNNDDRYFLQNFKPDNALSVELQKTKPYNEEEMNSLKNVCRIYIKNCMIRG